MSRPRIVRLFCPSDGHGYAEDASGVLRVRCKGKWCRIDGRAVIHLFDLATGDLRTLPDPFDGDGERPAPEEHDHAVHARFATVQY